jgi:EAL domain-containing protein (putative c-di-GMP-specific phosphodiesterase class I)
MLLAAAREIGADTIAEGIESEREASVCTAMGFNMAQGYLFSKPISLEVTQRNRIDGSKV